MRGIVDLGLRLTEGLKTWDVKPPFENLTGLDQIRTRRFEFCALPLHIKGAKGSPVRAMAVEHV